MDSNVQLLNEKVNKFLETEKFYSGSSLSNDELISVVERLGRTKNMFDIDLLDENYKEFLNEYGSLDGEGFEIVGPFEFQVSSEQKIEEMKSIQIGFTNRCRRIGMKKLNSIWLIASVDQEDEYYINLKSRNKDYIYSLDTNGRSRIYANNFLDFLDRFFEYYKRKDEEIAYNQEFYHDQTDSD